jgi:hypothetical protein
LHLQVTIIDYEHYIILVSNNYSIHPFDLTRFNLVVDIQSLDHTYTHCIYDLDHKLINDFHKDKIFKIKHSYLYLILKGFQMFGRRKMGIGSSPFQIKRATSIRTWHKLCLLCPPIIACYIKLKHQNNLGWKHQITPNPRSDFCGPPQKQRKRKEQVWGSVELKGRFDGNIVNRVFEKAKEQEFLFGTGIGAVVRRRQIYLRRSTKIKTWVWCNMVFPP